MRYIKGTGEIEEEKLYGAAVNFVVDPLGLAPRTVILTADEA